jgi:hypothetical protein
LPGFRAEQAAWRAGMMVRVQSIMIFLLLILLAEEYNYNESFQAWANGSLGMFGFLFSGSLAAVYGGVLIVLYLSPARPVRTQGKAMKRELVVVGVGTRKRRS